MNYILCILFFFLSILISYFIRRNEGSWYAPAAILSLLFTFVLGFSLLLAPDFYFSPLAILYIESILSLFFLGGIFTKKFTQNVNYIKLGLPRKPMIIIILLGTFVGFASVYFLLTITGFELSSLKSLSAYINISAELSKRRYDDLPLPRIIIICLTINYTSLIFSGFFYSMASKIKYKIIALFPLFPLLIFTLIYTSRSAFLFALTIFITSIIAAKVLKNEINIRLFTKRKVLTFTISLATIFIIFLITQMARYGIKNFYSFDNILYISTRLRIWFLGNLSGFSVWFDNSHLNNSPSLGHYSFGGLYELLGIESRDLGVFTDFAIIGKNGEKTNIYTLFRGLIEDFTIWGSFIIAFISGFLSKFVYIKVLEKNFITSVVLSAIYSEILWSCIVSFHYYNIALFSFIFAIIIISVFYFINFLKNNLIAGK